VAEESEAYAPVARRCFWSQVAKVWYLIPWWEQNSGPLKALSSKAATSALRCSGVVRTLPMQSTLIRPKSGFVVVIDSLSS